MVEQRRARRFGLELPLAVTRAGSQRTLMVCNTRNISSSGVLFTSQTELPSGPIEYTVTLASERDQKVMIRCIGKVVRLERSEEASSPNRIAATLERYEFFREPA